MRLDAQTRQDLEIGQVEAIVPNLAVVMIPLSCSSKYPKCVERRGYMRGESCTACQQGAFQFYRAVSYEASIAICEVSIV